MPCDSVVRFTRRVSVMVLTALLLLPTLGFAQSPWERAASNLERTFTGPFSLQLPSGAEMSESPRSGYPPPTLECTPRNHTS